MRIPVSLFSDPRLAHLVGVRSDTQLGVRSDTQLGVRSDTQLGVCSDSQLGVCYDSQLGRAKSLVFCYFFSCPNGSAENIFEGFLAGRTDLPKTFFKFF